MEVEKWDHFKDHPEEPFFLSLLFIVFIYFLKYETIVKSGASFFGHSGPDPSSMLREQSNSNSQEFNHPLSYTIFLSTAK